MNEEEAKRILIELSTFDYVKLENGDVAIETVLNLLEKKDKIIDLMGEKIFEEGIVWENKEDVKQYFERKVENGN